LKRWFSQLLAGIRQKLLGLLLVDAAAELQAEIDLYQADRLARLDAQARDYEQTGKPSASAYLRAAARAANLNLTGLAAAEAGIRHLLLTDATDGPAPALHPAVNGTNGEAGTRPLPPAAVKNRKRRPARSTKAAENGQPALPLAQGEEGKP
jgi:hypothetical protein